MRPRAGNRFLWAGLGLLVACQASSPTPLAPPGEKALEEFAVARTALQTGELPESVGDSLAAAERLAPDWAPPHRMRDDVRRSLLLGPGVMRERWEERARSPLSAYLIGRTIGSRSREWFARATRANPSDPWGWHGRAFAAARDGRTKQAMLWEAQAAELAREPFERSMFAGALARMQHGVGKTSEALATLQWAIDQDPGGPDRLGLQIDWVRYAAESDRENWKHSARTLARELLEAPELRPAQCAAVAEIGVLPVTEVASLLLKRPEEVTQVMGLTLLGPNAASLRDLLQSETQEHGRLTLFSLLQPVRAVQTWLESLPAHYGEHAGPPLDAWHDLGELAQEWEDHPSEATTQALCAALCRLGWFEEAQAFLRARPEGLTKVVALETERRAGAGLAAIARIRTLFRDLDQGKALLAREPLGRAEKVADLDGLVESLASILVETQGLDRDRGQAILQSPRQRFAGFAQVVNPGPFASKEDHGLGGNGEVISGLPEALLGLGRVGIFGSALGVGPDGTLLRLVGTEWIQGEHLGVPYEGSVLWCDGTDVGPQAMRAGGSIAGAALHEGYYLDISQIRPASRLWERLENLWQVPWQREALRTALSDPGLPVEVLQSLGPPENDRSGRFEAAGDPWLSTEPLLGQADRCRLSLLLERGRDGELGEVTLAELVDLTAVHEEGHLCDRTRFLPLRDNWGKVLAFATAHNFSAERIQEQLEYRAQLTALCVVPEPRLVLIDILDQAEGTGGGMPHGRAYERLLGDLLVVLARAIAGDAEWARAWRPAGEYLMVHQLHRLPAEVLREAGLRLARQHGL